MIFTVNWVQIGTIRPDIIIITGWNSPYINQASAFNCEGYHTTYSKPVSMFLLCITSNAMFDELVKPPVCDEYLEECLKHTYGGGLARIIYLGQNWRVSNSESNREQGWLSYESIRLPPMWAAGFDSWTRRNDQCGLSLLVLYSALRGFSQESPVFLPHQKPKFDLICRSPQLMEKLCLIPWDLNKVIPTVTIITYDLPL